MLSPTARLPLSRQRMRIPHGHHQVAGHSCSRCPRRHCSLPSFLECDYIRSELLEVEPERSSARAAAPLRRREWSPATNGTPSWRVISASSPSRRRLRARASSCRRVGHLRDPRTGGLAAPVRVMHKEPPWDAALGSGSRSDALTVPRQERCERRELRGGRAGSAGQRRSRGPGRNGCCPVRA